MSTVMATSSAPSDLVTRPALVERKIQEVTMFFAPAARASDGLISSDAALDGQNFGPVDFTRRLVGQRGFGVSNPIGERAGGRMIQLRKVEREVKCSHHIIIKHRDVA